MATDGPPPPHPDAEPAIRRIWPELVRFSRYYHAGYRNGHMGDPDDLLQAGALRAWRRSGCFDPSRGRAFDSFLLDEAIFGMKDAYRDSGHLGRVSARKEGAVRIHSITRTDGPTVYYSSDRGPAEHPGPVDPDPPPHARESAWDLTRRARRTLHVRDRVILALYFREGLTFRQIAEVFGMTESRIHQLFHRSLDMLRLWFATSARPHEYDAAAC